MPSKELFSKFLRYFFLINGIPVYCASQRKTRFSLWYAWKIFVVIRYNIDMLLQFHYMRVKWIFPYSLFSLNDVAAATLIVDSLIGKHNRILQLQNNIVDNQMSRNYCLSPEDKRKIKILQIFFGSVFTLCTVYLIFFLLRFPDIHEQALGSFEIMKFSQFYIFFLSTVSWIATISNTLFYCILCVHLQSMFKSINLKVEKLGRSSIKILDISNADSIFSRGDSKLEDPHENTMTCHSSIFPTSISFWPQEFSINSSGLASDLRDKINNHAFTSRRSIPNLGNFNCCEKNSECSCLVIGSSKYPRHPLKIAHSFENCCSSKDDIKRNNCFARKIQNLIKEFSSTALMVQEADNLFSLQVFAILTITFIRTCSYIYVYISSDWHKYDSYASLGISQQILFDFLAFGSVAFEASHVTDEARKFSRTVKGVEEIYNSKSLRVQVQSDVAQLTAYSFDVQLTAWKFFTVSRNFVPTVIGVTTTYVLIIFQLHQIVQEQKCSSLKNMTEVHLWNDTLEYF